MKKGGEHWQWRSDIPFYLGVLPRRGAKGSDVKVSRNRIMRGTPNARGIYPPATMKCLSPPPYKHLQPQPVTNPPQWFRAPNAFPGHTSNAYEDASGNIVFDLPLCDKNVFFWWPEADGSAPKPQELDAPMTRFTFDPRSADLDLPAPEILATYNCEFPRIDDARAMKDYAHVFMPVVDPALATDFPAIAPVMGGGAPFYNAMGHLNAKTKETKVYHPGTKHGVQEPVYIPKGDGAEEGDGYVLFLVNNFGEMVSELHLVDTRDFSKPQAIIRLPLKLRPGLHGNWVPRQELDLVQ